MTLRQPRTERSLYHRANGYNYEVVKIFMPANSAKPVYAPYIEHVPPDVTDVYFLVEEPQSDSHVTGSSRNDNLGDALRQHGGNDRADRVLLVQTGDDGGDYFRDGLRGTRLLSTAQNLSHKLHRSPQFAQAAGGRSDKSAARNAWYAGPFQISSRLCLVASPSV